MTTGIKQALLIGNNTYTMGPLVSCVNDAVDVSNSLRSIGFQVNLERNLDLRSMQYATQRFVRSIQPGSIVLLYYSGHGAQYDGYNFLMPTDASLEVSRERNYVNNMKEVALSAERLIEDMHSRNPRVVIVILDSCRSYLGPQSLIRPRIDQASSRKRLGLAPMRVPPSTIVAYACAAETESSQFARNNRNSLYTYHLLRYITTPNIDVDYLLRNVALAVQKDPDNLLKQMPYRYSSCNEFICLATTPNMYLPSWLGMMQTAQVFSPFKSIAAPVLSNRHFPRAINHHQSPMNFQYFKPNGYRPFNMNIPTTTTRYPNKRGYSSSKPLYYR